MPEVWPGVRSAKTALAGSIELFALQARTLVIRLSWGYNVPAFFADVVASLGDHDLELVPVNTVRTTYRVHRPLAFRLVFRFLRFLCLCALLCLVAAIEAFVPIFSRCSGLTLCLESIEIGQED